MNTFFRLSPQVTQLTSSNLLGNLRRPINCPNYACMLELDSLEFRSHSEQMTARSSYSVPIAIQIWVKEGRDLVRAIPLTDVEA
jgi:hypothetical protein